MKKVLVGVGCVVAFIIVVAVVGRSHNPAPSAPAPAAPSSATPAPTTELGAGIYQVGTDIQPGRYKTSGGSFCGWSRDSSDDGQLSSIIANDIVQGPGSVTVKSSDNFVQFSGDCTWTKQR